MSYDIPLAHEEDYRGHRIEIHYDTDVGTPHEWSDMFGTLVTWHRNYTFQEDGDKTFGSPTDFIENLAGICVEDLEEGSYDVYKDGVWSNDKGHGGQYKYNNRWRTEDELREIIADKAEKNAVWINVGMGDHSGIWFYEGRGAEMCDPGGWDSGQVGFLYARKDKVLEEFGGGAKTITAKVRERAERCLRGELETWDDYIRGNVFGYVVHTLDEDGESNDDHIDSCWGFYPDNEQGRILRGHEDYDYCLTEARSVVDYTVSQNRKSHFQKIKTWIRNRVPLNVRSPLSVA